MRVSSKTSTVRYLPDPETGSARIEFADPSSGGNSSSGEKHSYEEKAVRLAWWNAEGKYDPISSAELPYWAVLDVIEACAAADFIDPADSAKLIQALAASIERKSKA